MIQINRFIKVLLISAVVFGTVSCKDEIAEIGAQAPEIAVFDLQGNAVHLNDLQGKPVLLNFWSESCGICLFELNALQQRLQQSSAQIQVLAVNIDGERSDTAAVAEKNRLRLPIVKDQLHITAERYGLIGTPTSFIIDPNGKILYKFEGLIPEDMLQQLFKG
ncbi:TlpA family protein disulfide reductase [Necropsobacter massiliensis]|uniref:TlpA family protein disulfide reductase n=1 Tax=Necropsobacter massiliensis TaxID=1400001 RepID=UPI000596359F|nr:TlpA disulfide reductase family protein [Necropsobacter massiliensis]